MFYLSEENKCLEPLDNNHINAAVQKVCVCYELRTPPQLSCLHGRAVKLAEGTDFQTDVARAKMNPVACAFYIFFFTEMKKTVWHVADAFIFQWRSCVRLPHAR